MTKDQVVITAVAYLLPTAFLAINGMVILSSKYPRSRRWKAGIILLTLGVSALSIETALHAFKIASETQSFSQAFPYLVVWTTMNCFLFVVMYGVLKGMPRDSPSNEEPNALAEQSE